MGAGNPFAVSEICRAEVRHRVGNGRAGHRSPAGVIRSPCFAGMKQRQGFYLSPDQEMLGATINVRGSAPDIL